VGGLSALVILKSTIQKKGYEKKSIIEKKNPPVISHGDDHRKKSTLYSKKIQHL